MRRRWATTWARDGQPPRPGRRWPPRPPAQGRARTAREAPSRAGRTAPRRPRPRRRGRRAAAGPRSTRRPPDEPPPEPPQTPIVGASRTSPSYSWTIAAQFVAPVALRRLCSDWIAAWLLVGARPPAGRRPAARCCSASLDERRGDQRAVSCSRERDVGTGRVAARVVTGVRVQHQGQQPAGLRLGGQQLARAAAPAGSPRAPGRGERRRGRRRRPSRCRTPRRPPRARRRAARAARGASGTRKGMPASLILALARTSRCPIVAGATRKAAPISAGVEAEHGLQDQRACASPASIAGWAHANSRRQAVVGDDLARGLLGPLLHGASERGQRGSCDVPTARGVDEVATCRRQQPRLRTLRASRAAARCAAPRPARRRGRPRRRPGRR